MKKIFTFLILTVGSTFLIACFNNDKWYLLKKDNFSLSFPKKPTEEIKVINSQFGELKIIGNIYQVPDLSKDENLLYGIAETKYPDSSLHLETNTQLDSFLLEAVNGAVSKIGNRISPIKEITKDDFHGREFKIKHSKYPYIVTMNIYLVKNHVYSLQTITEESRTPNKSIDKFMSSFTLKKQ